MYYTKCGKCWNYEIRKNEDLTSYDYCKGFKVALTFLREETDECKYYEGK